MTLSEAMSAALIWAKDNSDAVQALSAASVAAFTVVLTIFTVSTARSTRRAANAAVLAAEAAIRIELPIITFEAPDLIAVEGIVGREPFGGEVIEGPALGEYNAIDRIQVFNIGRTAARPYAAKSGWHIGATPPSPLNYSSRFSLGDMEPLGAGNSTNIEVYTTITTFPEDLRRLESGEARVWIYFEYEYIDFLDRHHFARATWFWGREVDAGVFYFIRVDPSRPV